MARQYTPAQEDALYAALGALPTDSPLLDAFEDYDVLRREAQHCWSK